MVAATTVDVVDEAFLAVSPRVLAAVFADRDAWPLLWPDLRLEVVTDRGDEGLRWTVSGALVGSMEVWLEPVSGGGTVLHYFLRADPADRSGMPRSVGARRAIREGARRQRAAKRIALTLKRNLERGRPPGEPPRA